MLLVDHNVKSVAALVDRVLAMYLGERIAEGTRRRGDARRDRAPRLPRRRAHAGGAAGGRASPDAAPLLQVEDVGVLYGKALALQDVSLHVHEGEFVSVVGLNGAGKTTLFNAISGLVPYSGRDPLGRRVAGGPQPRRRSRAAASCSARRRASCSAT